MAKLTVDVVKIDEVQAHPNADRLSFARVGGYWVITGKDEYKAGDTAVYFPVDAILPMSLQGWLFSGTKMKLSKSRVRAAKIRGHMSMGLLASRDTIMEYFVQNKLSVRVAPGDDITKALGVTKHEPPVKAPRGMQVSQKAIRFRHETFRKYTSINHLQKFDTLFKENEDVVVTEKLHGTNFRAGWVPFKPRSLKQKLLNFLTKFTIWDFVPEWEFVVGSHNIEVDSEEPNVYTSIARDHNLANKIAFGHVWYGEIVGAGIQANYEYGYKPGKTDVFFMDIMDTTTGKYFSWIGIKRILFIAGEKHVPWYSAQYNIVAIQERLNVKSPYSNLDKGTYKEGYVIRPFDEGQTLGQRRILKLLSEKYLLQRGNTDFH